MKKFQTLDDMIPKFKENELVSEVQLPIAYLLVGKRKEAKDILRDRLKVREQQRGDYVRWYKKFAERLLREL